MNKEKETDSLLLLILSCNIAIIFLFYALSFLVIIPAYNHFVIYSAAEEALPLPTRIVLHIRLYTFLLPAIWAAFTCFIGMRIRAEQREKQTRILLFLSLGTCTLGLAMLLLFLLGGILPFLFIGSHPS